MYNQCPQGNESCDTCPLYFDTCDGWQSAAVDDRTPPEYGINKEDWGEIAVAFEWKMW